nr:tape measure protein [uncultured Mediterraneibacter sp.]
MSNVVDERVVEMRFDNAQFEKNVSTSMSTIQKLKQSLNFSGASKGLETISASANKVNFSGMLNGIETVNTRFSYLQATIQHQINNIVDSCVRAGHNIVAALTINPVKDGMAEYETQMNAVQTILANTQKEGTNVKVVNAALDELNHYADKTIYNFTEMTRNIGTFTAAGVKLDTSVSSIKGIANLAAVSGSTSQQASTAMYQLSQAIAAGTVKLMDWNSVVNAGMGGQVFQDALVRTAEHLKTGAKAAIEAKGSFRESLSEGWLTTEVLTQTLDQFATAADTEKEYEAAVKKFVSQGYSQEQAKQMADMARTANDAATKVKTFSQLIDTLKEALGSGWTETWRLIIGDFEEAKSLWTSVNDVLSPAIDKMSNARNALITSALGKSFSSLTKNISSALEPAAKAVDTVKEVTDSIGDLGSIVDDVIIGKFGNGQERFDALTEAGKNYYVIQNKVNETLGCSKRYTQEQIDAQNKLLGISSKATSSTEKESDATEKLTDDQKEKLKTLTKLSSVELKNLGYSKEQIKTLKELTNTAKKLGMPVDDFIDKMDEINGRWILIDSFKNIGKALITVFTSLGSAFKEVFGTLKADTLFNAIAAFHKFTAALILNKDNAEKLKSTFKGLFAAIDIIRTIAGGAVSIAIRLMAAALGEANINVLSFTARIGDAIVKFRDFLFNNELVNTGIQLLIKGFTEVGKIIGKVFDALLNNPITKGLSSIWDKLFGDEKGDGKGVVTYLKELGDAFAISEAKGDNFKTVMDGINSALNLSNWKWSASLTSGLKLLDAVLSLFGTNIALVGGQIADYIIQCEKWIRTNTIFVGMGNKIAQALQAIIIGINDCVTAFLSLKPVQDIIAKIRDTIADLFGTIGDGVSAFSIEGIISQIQNTFGSLKSWISSLDDSTQLGLDIVRGIGKGLTEGVQIAVNGIITVVNAIKETFCSLFGIHSPSLWGMQMAMYILQGIANGFKAFVGLIDDGVNFVVDHIKSYLSKIGVSVSGNFKSLFDSVSQVWTSFISLIKGIDFTKILAIIPVAVVVMFAKRIWSLATTLEEGINSINSVISNFADIEKSFAKLLDAKTAEIKSKAVLRLAIALGVLVASVVVLSKVNIEDLAKAVGAIVVLSGVLAALAFAISKLGEASVKLDSNGLNISGLKTTLLQIGAVMLMLAASVKIMGSMKPEEMKRAFDGLAACVLAILDVLIAAGILAKFGGTKDIDKIGNLLLKLSVSMLLMTKVCKLAGQLSKDEMINGAKFAGGVAAFVFAMSVCVRMAGNSINKLGSMILALSFSMILLVGVCKLAGQLSVKEMLKGAAFATVFAIFVAALKGISQAFPQAKMQKLSGMMIAFSIALGIMVGVCKLVSLLSINQMLKGAAFATAFIFFIKYLVKVTTITNEQQIAKVSGTIIAMSIAIGAMAAVCVLLSLLSPEMIIRGVGAVTVFGLLIAAMLSCAKDVGNVKGTIMMMAVCIGIMAASVAVLSFLDPEKLAVATACMSALMAMFALIEYNSKSIGKCLPAVIAMGAVLAVLAVALHQLNGLDGTNMLTTAASLSTVLLAISVALGIISQNGNISAMSLAGVGVMTLALYAIANLIGMLASIQGIENALTIAGSLAVLLISLSASLLILSKITNTEVDTKGIVKFAAMLGLLSKSMSMLIPVMKEIGTISWGDIGKSLATIGAALIVLSLGLQSMNGTLAGSAALLVAAGALTILTPVLQQLGSMSLTEIGTAVLALAGAFAVLGIAGAVLSPLVLPIIALSGALTLLGVAMLAFGGGVSLLANGLKTISSISSEAAQQLVDSIGIITTGILNLIPQITVAMSQAIVAVCQVITESAPQIGAAVVSLLTGVLTAMIESKAQFLESIATLLIGVLDGLTEQLPALLDSLSNFVVTLINGLSAHMPEFITAGINLVKSIVQGIVDNLSPILNGIVIPLMGAFRDALVAVITAIGPYIPDICNMFTQMTQIICDCITKITEILAPFIPDINEIVSSITTGVLAICDVFNSLIGQIAPIIDSISGLVQQLGVSITQVILALAVTIQTAGNSIAQILQEIGNVFETVFNGISEVVSSIGDAIKSSLDGVAEVISSVGDSVKTAFEGIADVISSVGDSIRTVLDGIAGIFESIGNAALNAGTGFNLVADGIKTIVSMNIVEVGVAMGAVAKGIKSIATNAEGLSAVGTGMQQVASSVTMTSTSITTMATHVTEILTALKLIGPTAASSMSMLSLSILTSLNSFSQLNSAATTAISGMMNSLVVTITSSSTLISSAFNTMMNSAVASITGKAAIFASAGKSMMSGFTSGVRSGASSVAPTVSSVITKALSSANSQKGKFITSGNQLMLGLRAGITNGTSAVNTAIISLLTKAYTTVLSRKSQFMSGGYQLVLSLANGIRSGASGVTGAVTSALGGCSSAIRSYWSSFYGAGSYLGSGLIMGIAAQESAAYSAGYNLGRAAVEGEKAGQQSHSPSKATKKAGKWLGEGLIIGIKQMGKSVYNAGSSMGETAVYSISEALSGINDLPDDDLLSPEICPVLNLSEVQAGMGAIQTMIGNQSALGLNVGSVKSLMNRRNQNRATNDVVAAINKLRDDIGNINNNSYTINGITYDNGSAVEQAVADLIRAVRLERRM